MEHIHIKGAREHNLKGLSVDIPRGKFSVFSRKARALGEMFGRVGLHVFYEHPAAG